MQHLTRLVKYGITAGLGAAAHYGYTLKKEKDYMHQLKNNTSVKIHIRTPKTDTVKHVFVSNQNNCDEIPECKELFEQFNECASGELELEKKALAYAIHTHRDMTKGYINNIMLDHINDLEIIPTKGKRIDLESSDDMQTINIYVEKTPYGISYAEYYLFTED
jgi:hypothetical protein